MQTFMPFPNFAKSASVLDRLRLGKQRLEAKQIILALENGGGWSNHPAVIQWKGYEYALAIYGMSICSEWTGRGYRDTLLEFFVNIVDANEKLRFSMPMADLLPPWFGDDRYHSSHRAALLAKNPEWYGQFGWKEEPEIEYFWPSKEGY